MTPVPVYVSTLIYLKYKKNNYKKKKGPEDSNNLLTQMVGKVMAENGHHKICNTFCYNIIHTFLPLLMPRKPLSIHTLFSTNLQVHFYIQGKPLIFIKAVVTII